MLTCESNTVYDINNVKTQDFEVAFISWCYHR